MKYCIVVGRWGVTATKRYLLEVYGWGLGRLSELGDVGDIMVIQRVTIRMI